VERICCGDFIGDCLGTAICSLRFCSFFQFPTERIRDITDLGLVGKDFEEPFAQDVIDFVGCEVYRRNTAFLTPQFGARIFKRAVNELCPGVVSGRESDTTTQTFCFFPAAVSRLAKARVAMSATVPFQPFGYRDIESTAASHRAE